MEHKAVETGSSLGPSTAGKILRTATSLRRAKGCRQKQCLVPLRPGGKNVRTVRRTGTLARFTETFQPLLCLLINIWLLTMHL